MCRRVCGRGRVYGHQGRTDSERKAAGDVTTNLEGAAADAVDEEEEDELGEFADDGVDALVEQGLGCRDTDLGEDGGREVLDGRDASPVGGQYRCWSRDCHCKMRNSNTTRKQRRNIHLRRRLARASQNNPPGIGSIGEQLLIRLGPVPMLLFDLLLDQFKLGQDICVVLVAVGVQSGEVPQPFFVPVMIDQPPRRLREKEDARGQSDGGDDL